ncbi:MAG: sigma-70 region 4 domain-containing protein [Verrucomicrobia bacterium]|nr:sigma-70 region 4 domain-containing protein [Verrucomicrobiota bacterium]
MRANWRDWRRNTRRGRRCARVAGGDVFEALEDCMEQLPDTLRGAVDAFYLKDLSGADAAKNTGSSEASLRKRLQRARALLKDCLTNKATDNHFEKGEL